jgi:hypothetical protein
MWPPTLHGRQFHTPTTSMIWAPAPHSRLNHMSYMSTRPPSTHGHQSYAATVTICPLSLHTRLQRAGQQLYKTTSSIWPHLTAIITAQDFSQLGHQSKTAFILLGPLGALLYIRSSIQHQYKNLGDPKAFQKCSEGPIHMCRCMYNHIHMYSCTHTVDMPVHTVLMYNSSGSVLRS